PQPLIDLTKVALNLEGLREPPKKGDEIEAPETKLLPIHRTHALPTTPAAPEIERRSFLAVRTARTRIPFGIRPNKAEVLPEPQRRPVFAREVFGRGTRRIVESDDAEKESKTTFHT